MELLSLVELSALAVLLVSFLSLTITAYFNEFSVVKSTFPDLIEALTEIVPLALMADLNS